jgi:hypothetical protein
MDRLDKWLCVALVLILAPFLCVGAFVCWTQHREMELVRALPQIVVTLIGSAVCLGGALFWVTAFFAAVLDRVVRVFNVYHEFLAFVRDRKKRRKAADLDG